MKLHASILCLLACVVASLAAADASECNKAGAAESLQQARSFLAENRTRAGVVTTDSGLQYTLLQEGDGGQQPRSRGTVVAHYELFNLAGEKLESSRDRRAPLQFDVTGVIPGWQEALVSMTVGERRQLFVPPELAYGCKGSSPKIGPNQLLIFDVELLHIIR